MTLETYTAFVLFAIVMTGTPGVGNLTMMAIGQTTGFRSSVPFLLGTTVGMICLNTLVSFGLGGVFMASPKTAWAMKIGGMGYILYLAWKIMVMQLSERRTDRRFSFLEGVFLHPANPKSWAMSVVGFSQISSPSMSLVEQAAIFIPTFMVFQMTFHSLWGLGGAAIMRAMRSRAALTAINGVLVTVMVGATMYALFV